MPTAFQKSGMVMGTIHALNDVLGKRDDVTAALATSEPNVTETLHGIEPGLRRALSFVMPPSSPAAP